MDWQNVLGVAATVFALASAAGLGLMRGTLGNLRASNTDLRERVTDLEKERAEDHSKITALEGKVAAAEDREHYLQSIVQGRVEWTAISDQLEDVHRILVLVQRKVGA
jgi:hypothetical protein